MKIKRKILRNGKWNGNGSGKDNDYGNDNGNYNGSDNFLVFDFSAQNGEGTMGGTVRNLYVSVWKRYKK